MNEPRDIVEQFSFPSEVEKVEIHGNGIINDTYVVTFSNPPKSGHSRFGKRAILQRINSEVFPDPPSIMHNLAIVLQHAASKSSEANLAPEFLLPSIYKTKKDDYCYRDASGNYWRAIAFIEQTITADSLQNRNQAKEAGTALGTFHQILSDLPVDQLKDTLPGFHDTPNYLSQYEVTIAQAAAITQTNENRDFCEQQIEKHRALARLFVDANPPLRTAVMHGDPKLNNILFDEHSGKAVSLIDLDTVKPGFIHYDIGDCIRSCCNTAGEMPLNIQDVHFSVDDFEAILQGYLSRAMDLLTEHDFERLYDVVRLLPFELGLRFFTDYLNGNRYFKVESDDDNLYRAQVQFQLLNSIENQERQIREIVAQCRHNSG